MFEAICGTWGLSPLVLALEHDARVDVRMAPTRSTLASRGAIIKLGINFMGRGYVYCWTSYDLI